MTNITTNQAAEVFFLPGISGNLYAMYTPAHPDRSINETVIIIPPFAGEMNRARRMMSLQARHLSDMGIGTLIIDLYGTGDSEGDFSDARWKIWKSDIDKAVNWVRQNTCHTISILGIRLGALLAVDYAAHCEQNYFKSILMWQPTISGEMYLKELLLVRVVNSMRQRASKKVTIAELRRALSHGDSVEVAGYELTPDLVNEINRLDMSRLIKNSTIKLHWIEISQAEEPSLLPASKRLIETLTGDDISLKYYVVAGRPFWSGRGISVVPELLDVTTTIFTNGKNSAH